MNEFMEFWRTAEGDLVGMIIMTILFIALGFYKPFYKVEDDDDPPFS